MRTYKKIDSSYRWTPDRLFYFTITKVMEDIEEMPVKELQERIILYGFWKLFFGWVSGVISLYFFVLVLRGLFF